MKKQNPKSPRMTLEEGIPGLEGERGRVWEAIKTQRLGNTTEADFERMKKNLKAIVQSLIQFGKSRLS